MLFLKKVLGVGGVKLDSLAPCSAVPGCFNSLRSIYKPLYVGKRNISYD